MNEEDLTVTQTDALRAAHRAALRKAAAPDPTATPAPTYVRSDPNVGPYSITTTVPSPSPELDAAGWAGAGPVTRWQDAIGTGDQLDPRGHSDLFMPSARRVIASGVQNPQLDQVGQRGGDFTASPVSPLPGWRGAPVSLDTVGRQPSSSSAS